MSKQTTHKHNFITYLEGLREDRGALAALRRGLGKPPGTVPEMHQYVMVAMPNDLRRWQQDIYYIVAALFAMHPDGAKSGNMGDHFAKARRLINDPTAIERRFTTLLAAHVDDLPVYLRQAVSYLRSKDVPVNWHQLIWDLRNWGHPDRYVQRWWAGSFWSSPREEETDTSTE
jgi:CRISPR system Cascade subunit CasB